MAKEGMITPQPLMGRINRISRCFTLYRNNQLEQEGLNGYQHLYICLLYTSTGMAVIFAEVGQEVHINGSFEEAVQEGVRRGYTEGLLRCSVVKDPIRRGNTGDNTPAILHVRLVPGDRVSLTVAPKGFGSENMSRINMFTPSATEQDIIGFVTETARLAGGNACPPMVLGVGIGGDFEKCALLAKQALCRAVSERNADPYYAGLEQRMLEAVNCLLYTSTGRHHAGDAGAFPSAAQ